MALAQVQGIPAQVEKEVQVMVYICQEKSKEKAGSLHNLSTAHFMS